MSFIYHIDSKEVNSKFHRINQYFTIL